MTPTSSPASDARFGGVTVAVAIVWMAVIAYAIFPVLPYSPVRLPFAHEAMTVLWAPQGWSFFTRDPREEKQTLYVRNGSTWESASLAPHARLSNFGGLRRKSRAQGVEMALLINGVPATEWQHCSASLQECLAQLPAGRAVRNTSPAPTLCGTVAVVLQKPVPWAWARSARPVTMPFRMLPLEVSCSPG
jgi:antimicrobial peptide system SdpA family protein